MAFEFKLPKFIGKPRRVAVRANALRAWLADFVLPKKPITPPGFTSPAPDATGHVCEDFSQYTDRKGVTWYKCKECGFVVTDSRFFRMQLEYANRPDLNEELEHQTEREVLTHQPGAANYLRLPNFHCMMVMTHQKRITITVEV